MVTPYGGIGVGYAGSHSADLAVGATPASLLPVVAVVQRP